MDEALVEIDNLGLVDKKFDSRGCCMYYKNNEVRVWTSADGFYNNIWKVDLNTDNIPDFIFENAFEDGSILYAIISKSDRDFQEKLITDDYGGYYCIESSDTTQGLHPLVIKDINNNGNNEVIVNLAKLNNKLFSISCTDTFYIDR